MWGALAILGFVVAIVIALGVRPRDPWDDEDEW